jgi:hypothetical protein
MCAVIAGLYIGDRLLKYLETILPINFIHLFYITVTISSGYFTKDC